MAKCWLCSTTHSTTQSALTQWSRVVLYNQQKIYVFEFVESGRLRNNDLLGPSLAKRFLCLVAHHHNHPYCLQRARSKITNYEVDGNRTRDPPFGGHTARPIRPRSQRLTTWSNGSCCMTAKGWVASSIPVDFITCYFRARALETIRMVMMVCS